MERFGGRDVAGRLNEVHADLIAARRELEIIEEQLVIFDDTAEDARVRSLVAESPLAGQEWREAKRHAEAMQRGREAAKSRVAELERARDDLLSKL
ncbi:MAG: hypothetical protein ACRDZ5_02600 [Acidimicrobiales bacterium]